MGWSGRSAQDWVGGTVEPGVGHSRLAVTALPSGVYQEYILMAELWNDAMAVGQPGAPMDSSWTLTHGFNGTGGER